MEAEDAASIGSSSSGIVEDAGLSDVDIDDEFLIAHDDLLYDVGYDTEATETTDAVDDFVGLDPAETESNSDGAPDEESDSIFSLGHLILAVGNNNNNDPIDDDLDPFRDHDDEDRHATGNWTSTESLYNGDTDIADIDSYDLAPEPSSASLPQTRKRLRTISDSSTAVVSKKRRARQFEMVQLFTALESE
uniref:DDE_Tnp_1_7 domain-containing protein n=1 Tax=Panagrellus redivivus TaxID=6233 RepID=A0A7E4UT36_PANRE